MYFTTSAFESKWKLNEIAPLLATLADERVEKTNRSRDGSVAATASTSDYDMVSNTVMQTLNSGRVPSLAQSHA